MPEVIGVAGMPGSGKSAVMQTFADKGFDRFDDMNAHLKWDCNVSKAKQIVAAGWSAVMTDILFCKHEWRAKLERELGFSIRWICFENNPHQCALNVVYLKFGEGHDRKWFDEMYWIDQLTGDYQPMGDIRPVVVAKHQA
jgi:hypothetical protein